jgi:hypothetical protein
LSQLGRFWRSRPGSIFKRESFAVDDAIDGFAHLAAYITAILGNTTERLIASRFYRGQQPIKQFSVRD